MGLEQFKFFLHIIFAFMEKCWTNHGTLYGRLCYKYHKGGPGSLVGTSYLIPAVVAIESNFGPQKIQLQGVLFEFILGVDQP